MARGRRESGDLIPWCVSQQFQDDRFPQLSGARIIRIAVHPKLHRMGYASRAMELLTAYYSGDIISLDEDVKTYNNTGTDKKEDIKTTDENKLLSEKLAPRTGLKPMLIKLSERPPEPIHYLGVSYGLTLSLMSFWQKNGFTPVYIRQTANQLTGEHTCIMMKPLQRSVSGTMPSEGWLDNFSKDFQKRFISLLGSAFRIFSSKMALTVCHSHEKNAHKGAGSNSTAGYGEAIYDLKRIESYARNLVDFHLVLDLVPTCAKLFFEQRLDVSSLFRTKSSILLGLGLQRKSVDELRQHLGLEMQQVLSLFNKCMRKISNCLRGLEEAIAEKEMKSSASTGIRKSEEIKKTMQPVAMPLDKELADGGRKAIKELRKKQESSILDDIDIKQYAIKGSEDEWKQATSKGRDGIPARVAIKSGVVEKKKKKGKKRKNGSVDGKKKMKKKKKLKS
eukprot:CAMPEP_0167758110 /NCGR_PEP_ID=MMETSP0110_2-20121227/10289_1 /TAXON_ID=629695 /ORGANISM="Gymnochlora sp., Strain CCMP2014" /LENGTH=448 /DNA_ID=CAMNT_0007644355 /DNA_START=541 /DNA_END=1886 /DNA_ORIENTATION=-